MEQVKFKKLKEGAVIPTQSTPGAAAYDLVCPETQWIPSGRGVIKLGFAMELPESIGAIIFARSGFEVKGFIGYISENSETESRIEDCDVKLGLADEDYRGEVGVLFHNYGRPFIVKKGQRIAQMLLVKAEHPEWIEVKELSDTERGDGGFGHTGK